MGVCNTNNDPSNISDRIRRVPDRLKFAQRPGWHTAEGVR